MPPSPLENSNQQGDKIDQEAPEKSERSQISITDKIFNLLTKKYTIALIIILGATLRIISFTRITIWFDGAFYADIGWGITKYGSFATGTENYSTWNYSLTYPLYLSLFYKLFGYNVFSTKLASLIAGVLAIYIVYLTTANIFGKPEGIILATIIALSPWVIFATGANITENLLIIFLSLTLWGIIKSSDDPRYLTIAGIFATLTYFTKTNIGIALIILALLFFVIWQAYYQKKRIFKNPHLFLFLAIVMFGALLRSYMIASTSSDISGESGSITHFLTLSGLIQFLFELPFHLLLPATYFLFFIPETNKAFSMWRTRNISLLILVILGGLGLILIHATARQTWLQTLPGASERYYTTFIVPTIWLFLGYIKSSDGNQACSIDKKMWIERKLMALENFLIKRKKLCFLSALLIGGFIFILVDLWWGVVLSIGALSFFILEDVKGRIVLLLIAFLIAGIGSTLDYHHTLQFTEAMDEIHNYVNEGDTIAIDSDSKALSLSFVSVYLGDIDDIEVVEYDPQGSPPTYIISQKDITYDNYTLLKTYNDTSPLHLRAWIYTNLKRTFIDSEFEWGRNPPMKVWIRD